MTDTWILVDGDDLAPWILAHRSTFQSDGWVGDDRPRTQTIQYLQLCPTQLELIPTVIIFPTKRQPEFDGTRYDL
jgi:hypothetical protein